MDNPQDINYHSKDIDNKKKKINFNVWEKKSDKYKSKLYAFRANVKAQWSKFLVSPLMKGNHKFITLGVAVVVITTAIALPIILPKILSGDSGSGSETAREEEEQEEYRQVTTEVADTVNNLDPNASDETKDTVLADLDSKIASVTDNEAFAFFTSAKALALYTYERYSDAIDILEPLVDGLRSSKDWNTLRETYSLMGNIHVSAGDNSAALEAYRAALAVISEAANDPDQPMDITGASFLERQISELENL